MVSHRARVRQIEGLLALTSDKLNYVTFDMTRFQRLS